MGFLKATVRRVRQTKQPQGRLWVYLPFVVVGLLLLVVLDQTETLRKLEPKHGPLNNFLFACKQAKLSTIIVHYRSMY